LYRASICLRFENRDKPTLDILFGAELKAGHTADDLSVKLIRAQRFAPYEMWIRWAIEPTSHPGMTEEV
jgi:hypothetical protein